jgi:16S rRNA (guanine966-N2)-methyltransferase
MIKFFCLAMQIKNPIKSTHKKIKRPNAVRIIGGKWRGRRLHFQETAGLRPTKDMVRETVFNWLSPALPAATVLDLFAGSGALGFEALSRGARYALFIDQSKKVIANLREISALLHADNADFLWALMPRDFKKISTFLRQIMHNADMKFNLIFLDPPFHKNLIAPTCALLSASDLVTSDALIYLEAERDLIFSEVIPQNWQIIKHKFSGDIQYCLCCTGFFYSLNINLR